VRKIYKKREGRKRGEKERKRGKEGKEERKR
jgi:hypothetical protein